MVLEKKRKEEIIAKFRRSETDSGSPQVQIALITERIKQLVEHLKRNKKDHHSRRGLLLLVGQRKRLLFYLKENDEKGHTRLVAELGLG